jgi:hypothetical protein
MTPTQFKIFAWFYTLVDSMIGGAATALAIAFTSLPAGAVMDKQTLARTALVAAATHAVYYLRQSPLPQLIANRQGNPPTAQAGPQATLADGLRKLEPPPFFERPGTAASPVRQVVITEINQGEKADEAQSQR